MNSSAPGALAVAVSPLVALTGAAVWVLEQHVYEPLVQLVSAPPEQLAASVSTAFAFTGGAVLSLWLVLCFKRFCEIAHRSNSRLATLLRRRKLGKINTEQSLELRTLSPIQDKRTAYQFLFDDYGWKMTTLAVAVLAVQFITYFILYTFALDDAVRECEEYVRNSETGELELRSERGSSSALEQLGYALLVLIVVAHVAEDFISSVRLLKIGAFRLALLYAVLTAAASVYAYEMIALSCTLLDAFVNSLALLFVNLLDEEAYTLVRVAGLLPAAARAQDDDGKIVVSSVHAFLRTRSPLGWLFSILTACAQVSIVVMALSARQTAERIVVPDPPPPPPRPPPASVPPSPPGICVSTCARNGVLLVANGVCDDGGQGSTFDSCALGTDCEE
ncbi:hypothetical protein AB1Y20_017989 [Prymnesium parvum]|uniref:Uncharacterized protein n=1 Tax=Prymnesium parvum TaxID=97485 RepID=A0AB34JQI6_PRYPA